MKLNKKLFTAGATLLTAFSLAQIPVHASNVTWKNDDGVALKSNWLHHYGNEYYFDHDGHRVEGLKKISGQTYFFNQDGVMVRNVQETVKGKTYFFNQAGEMVKDYYAKNGNDVYYYGKDGALVSDYWQTKNGQKYFYDETGLQWSDTTGMINGKLYYFDASGALATNKDIEFDGVTYHADKNGVLTEKQTPADKGFDESQINYDYALASWEGSPYQASWNYIILHEVGAESGAAANARYLKNNWTSAYTQFVVGDGGQVFEVGEPGYISWGALDANPYSPVQIELGRTYDRAQFIKDFTKYIQVARYYSQKYGIPMVLDGSGNGDKTHYWVTQNYGGSHVDPYGYLASWGIDSDDLANYVANGVTEAQLQKVVYSQRQ